MVANTIRVEDIPNNDNDPCAPSPPRWSNALPLRDDQRRALGWMQKKESEGRLRAASDHIASAWRTLSCVGCLADKIGYGKTAVSLALIDSDKHRQIGAHTKLFTTAATLVIAPTHVVDQWNVESQKFLGTSAKVIVLKTIEPLKGRWNANTGSWSRKPLVVRDIQEADIVVATYALIAPHAVGYSQRFKALTSETVKVGGLRALECVTANKMATMNYLDFEFPLLNQFHWKRQIIDEIQDAYDWSSPMSYEWGFSKIFLLGLSVEARWVLTGTPEGLTVLNLQDALGRTSSNLLADHVRRNTDCYVEGIDSICIDQRIILIDLSQSERICLLAHRVLDHAFKRYRSSHSLFSGSFHFRPGTTDCDLNLFGMCAHPAAGLTGLKCHEVVPSFRTVLREFARRLRNGDEVLKYDGSVLERGYPVEMFAKLPVTDPQLIGISTYQDLVDALISHEEDNDASSTSSSKVTAIAENIQSLIATPSGDAAVIVFTPWHDHVIQKAIVFEVRRFAEVRSLERFANARSITKTLREFNEGQFHILVLDIGKFSAGVSLSRATDVMFVSADSNVNREIQAIGRVRRLGFKGDVVRVHRFAAHGVKEEEELSRRNQSEVEKRLTKVASDEAERREAVSCSPLPKRPRLTNGRCFATLVAHCSPSSTIDLD